MFHFKWTPDTISAMYVDDIDERGLFFWNRELEKMEKDYKKMLPKK